MSWTLDVDDGLAVLTFTRPPANWMDLVSMTDLADRLEELSGRADEVRAVMLTGGLDGYFIAHADLDDLAVLARGELPEGDPTAWTRALSLLGSLPQPTIAAIDGQAWGGGLETALACDMRLLSERAHVGQPEVIVGIIPGAGGTQRLPRLVGSAVAIEMVTSGRILSSEEALRVGLANAVLPTDGFRAAAVEWCRAITRNPGSAVFAAKAAVVQGAELPLDEALALEGRLFLEINASDEARARNASVDRPPAGG